MRFAFPILLALILLAAIASAGPVWAQEDVDSSSSAQTSAPNISLGRAQAASCGVAPGVNQINWLIDAVRRMMSASRPFADGLRREMGQPCHRNRVAIYLIKTIAINNWAFLPAPGMRAGYPPGAIACGPAAQSADLNAVIRKIRPASTNPAAFNANITNIAKGPCINGRAMLYLFNVIADNKMVFRR